MQSELKPCPFCGGNNLRFRLSDIEGWIAHVECTDCDDMLGPMSEYKHDDKEDAEKDASEVWNRRNLEDELYARGYGLRCAIVDFLNGIGTKNDLRQRFADWEAASGTKFVISPAFRNTISIVGGEHHGN
jgi:Lar family restriction alleviation protein